MALLKGKKQDLRVFKESKIKVKQEIEIIAYQGYQGINRYPSNSRTPYKKPKKDKLTKEQKQ